MTTTIAKKLTPETRLHWFGFYLDDGHLAAEHHDDAHLEEDSEGVTDVVGIELLETFGAVTALK